MMQSILDELYDQYSRHTAQSEAQRGIDESHKQLIAALDKPERKLVLRIIDNKDLIAGAHNKESFRCGFWLAWQLFTQLGSYDSGRSLEKVLNAGDRCAMPQDNEEDDELRKTDNGSCFKDLE